MMASFMSFFGSRRDTQQSTRDAIVTLRQQLQLIEKKEDYLQKKINEELRKAKENVVSNKAGTSVRPAPGPSAGNHLPAELNFTNDSGDRRATPEEG